MTLQELKDRFEELKTQAPHISDVCKNIGGENYKIPDQIGSEFQSMIEYYAALQAKTVLEIGTYQGGSLWYLIKYAGPNATVITIDIDHTQCNCWDELFALRSDVKLIKISGRSEDPETIDKVKQISENLDFVFIDGYHYFPNVRDDWEIYGKKSKVCAFHDVGNGEFVEKPQDVRVMWNEIMDEYGPKTLSMIHKDYQKSAYGIGIVEL